MRFQGVWLAFLFFCSGFLHQTLADTVPPPPSTYILDEPQVLNPEKREILNRLFNAQYQTTGEQIVFAIFKSIGAEDPVLWTNQIFKHWQIGQKGKDNGVLLALYWKEHKARIEVGYGLEPILTDAKSKRILAEILAPELRQGRPNEALILTAIEILKVLNSPLITNGTANKILGGMAVSRASYPNRNGHSDFIWYFLGFLLIFLFFRMAFASAERRFERNTWHPYGFFPFRWRRRRKDDDDFFGGGGFGGPGDGGGGWGGGDDGFRGGGGSSGGGGASQDW